MFIFFVFLFQTSAQKQSFPEQLQEIQELRKLSRDESLDIETRIDYAKQASNLSSFIKNDSISLDLSNNLVYLYILNHNLEMTYKLSHKNLKLSDKINDTIVFGFSNHYLGWYFDIKNTHLDSAFYYYNISKTIHKKNNRIIDYIDILININSLQLHVKDYLGAEKTLTEALVLLRPFTKTDNNLDSYNIIYNDFGRINRRLKRFNKALESFDKAILYNNKIKNKKIKYENHLYTQINTAEVYQDIGNYGRVFEIYHKLLDDKELLTKEASGYAAILLNIANTRVLQGGFDIDSIENLYKRSYHISDSIEDLYNLTYTNNDLSKFYSKIGKQDSALHYAKAANKLSRETYINEVVLESLLQLSKLESGDKGKAYLYEYIALNDSILAKERSMRNKFARIQFETDEIEAENIQISKERHLFLLISIGLLTTLLLSYIIVRQRTKNRALVYAQEQQERNQEVYSLLQTQQQKLEEGRLEERNRISAELHDGILGRLFGTRLGVSYLDLEGETDALKGYIDELQSIEKEIRDVSHELKQKLDTQSDFITILEQYISQQMQLHDIGYKIENDSMVDWSALSDKVKVNVYRIVQESLQNVIKHARAEVFSLEFKKKKDKLKIQIEDNGVGYDNKNKIKGIGLNNMRDRVYELEGDIVINTIKEQGTKIEIEIPV